jgi:hypothetical protein
MNVFRAGALLGLDVLIAVEFDGPLRLQTFSLR